MAKSKEDRYERPTEFALALKQAVGAGAASGVSAVVAQPGAGETVLAGASVVGRAQAEEQAEPPAQSPPAESSPAQSPPAESSPAQPAPAGTGSGGGYRRKLLIAGGILAVVLAAVLIPLLAFSGGKSSSAEETTPTTTAAQSGGTTGGATPATLLSVLAPSQVAKECTPQNTRAQDALETNLCVSAPDGSNLSTRPVPVLVLSQLSGSAARLRASSQASAWHERRGRGVRLSPSRRTPVAPPDRQAGRAVLLLPGQEGEFRHRLDAREARQRRPRRHARVGDRAWAGTDDRRRLVELAQRLHR